MYIYIYIQTYRQIDKYHVTYVKSYAHYQGRHMEIGLMGTEREIYRYVCMYICVYIYIQILYIYIYIYTHIYLQVLCSGCGSDGFWFSYAAEYDYYFLEHKIATRKTRNIITFKIYFRAPFLYACSTVLSLSLYIYIYIYSNNDYNHNVIIAITITVVMIIVNIIVITMPLRNYPERPPHHEGHPHPSHRPALKYKR